MEILKKKSKFWRKIKMTGKWQFLTKKNQNFDFQ